MNGRQHKKSPVKVEGPWFAIPLPFLRSRACAELSPHALKLFIDLCSQFGMNAGRNGDLTAAPKVMERRGWASKATLSAALRELEDANLLVITRRGSRNRCSLYALTLWPMDCDFRKLDHGPGCYKHGDWRADLERAAEPTDDRPARWGKARRRDLAPPATGEPEHRLPPPRGNKQLEGNIIAPLAGAVRRSDADVGSPATGHLSRLPSPADAQPANKSPVEVEVGCGQRRLGRIRSGNARCQVEPKQ